MDASPLLWLALLMVILVIVGVQLGAHERRTRRRAVTRMWQERLARQERSNRQ